MTTATKEKTQKYVLIAGTYARRVGEGEGQLIISHPGEILELSDAVANTMRDKLMSPEKFAVRAEEFAERAAQLKAEKEAGEELENTAKPSPEVAKRSEIIDAMQEEQTARRRIM